MRLRDLTGERFGKWLVLRRAKSKKGSTYWEVQCECGAYYKRTGTSLTRGMSTCCMKCRSVKAFARGARQREEEVGSRYGRLTVKRALGVRKSTHNSYYECVCDCGKTVEVSGGHLHSGHTRSCGCLVIETTRKRSTTHGKRHAPEYPIWCKMRVRCSSSAKGEERRHYYERGIRVYAGWLGPNGFERFLAYVGPRPSPRHTLDRIDNNGNYEPGNVRWATRVEQARNTRSNRLVTFNGRTQTVAAWEAETNLPVGPRLQDDWSVEDALTRPLRKMKPAAQWDSRQPMTRLSDEQVVEIYTHLKAQTETPTALAERYGVSPSTICNIRLGKARRRLGLQPIVDQPNLSQH